MARVIIVSNRLPISVKKEGAELEFSPSLGGLATGLSSYVNDPGNIWIGWPGIASDELSEAEKQTVTTKLREHNCYPVFLSKKQLDDFYNGYSNSILWPVFHGLPTRSVDEAKTTAWWQAYRRVNERFSEAVTHLASPKSQIWVHDYQLLLLPDMLRQEKSIQHIGFFLHIPFPDAKAMARIKEGKKLAQGMLGASLLGFHTTEYVQNFLDYCAVLQLGTHSEKLIKLADRSIRVAEFPMGIDYNKYAQAGKSKVVKQAVRRYKKRYAHHKLIVSVDRLDPTKGLVERLIAFREFLERNPRWHKKVIFAMVAAPSRTDITAYKKLAKQLDELVQDINQTYGMRNWQPIDYINTSQPFEEVAALFQIADIAFIVPLRDGMNLAAKEFIASNKKRGVLILSESAGAAEELQDALIVNPEQPESLVSALEQAVIMQRKELRHRLNHMKKELSIHTVHHWAKNFVDALQHPIPGTPHFTKTLSPRLYRSLRQEYKAARKRLLFLDYDGTLVAFRNDYREAKPSRALLQLLKKISSDPRNEVVLISGRSANNLDNWFGDLPMNLVAEHGAAIKKVNHVNWHLLEKDNDSWQQLVLPKLEHYTHLTPGSRVEKKINSLVWHYRGATPYHGQKYGVLLKKSLRSILRTNGLELLQGNKTIEIKNPRISKANAAEQWLKQKYPFILSLGDDTTDETLFLALPVTSNSIKIGRGATAARFRLPASDDAVALLQKLAKT